MELLVLGCLLGLAIVVVWCLSPLAIGLIIDSLVRSHRHAEMQAQNQAVQREQEHALQEFHERLASARGQLCGRVTKSRVSLLNTVSNLLEPMHYIGGIEGAVCVYLDAEKRILDVQHWVGDGWSVPMPPDAIAARAKTVKAVAVALAHNHPNNRSTPSEQDVWHSANLKEVLEAEGVSLVEHYVWCGNQYKSVLDTRRFKQLVGPIDRLP